MARGTFANNRLRNYALKDKEDGKFAVGSFALHAPTGDVASPFDVSQRYASTLGGATPLVIVAGSEYGSGSSRDWAAKGPRILGVRAVIAESFERIHRANLCGMGVVPLQIEKVTQGGEEDAVAVTGRLHELLTGDELFDVLLPAGHPITPRQKVTVQIRDPSSAHVKFTVHCLARVDTAAESKFINQGNVMTKFLNENVA